MKLIVGLGNPGLDYARTRHNAGFMAMDAVAAHFGFSDFKPSDKHRATLAEGQIGGEKVILAKPQTFMNLSGQSVRSLVQFYKIPLENLVVVYDDVAIPSGELRVRKEGSAGGHNGMKSIIQELGTQNFVRVRLGIEPMKPLKAPLEDYVLGVMTKAELERLHDNLDRIPSLLETLFKSGVEAAMAEYN